MKYDAIKALLRLSTGSAGCQPALPVLSAVPGKGIVPVY